MSSNDGILFPVLHLYIYYCIYLLTHARTHARTHSLLFIFCLYSQIGNLKENGLLCIAAVVRWTWHTCMAPAFVRSVCKLQLSLWGDSKFSVISPKFRQGQCGCITSTQYKGKVCVLLARTNSVKQLEIFLTFTTTRVLYSEVVSQETHFLFKQTLIVVWRAIWWTYGFLVRWAAVHRNAASITGPKSLAQTVIMTSHINAGIQVCI